MIANDCKKEKHLQILCYIQMENGISWSQAMNKTNVERLWKYCVSKDGRRKGE